MLGTLVYSALDITFNTVCWTVNKTFSGVYGLYTWYYDENTDKKTDENTKNIDSKSRTYFLIDRINQQDEKIKTLKAELIELQNLKK
tara:strand:- start:440 stop:700 length:261 start_codon:yes stop_codon:yes gene_type:complete